MATASSSVPQAAAAAAMESASSQRERPRATVAGGGGGGPKSRHHAYSRKQKSLGLLCSNFVALYDRDNVELLGLDEAARSLGVEKRRIYDIVNVLESIGDWALGEKSGLVPSKMEPQSAGNVSHDEDDDKLGEQDDDTDSEKLSQTVDKPGAPQRRLRCDHRKEKSLRLLTENFVKLFLTMEVDTISLDEVSKLLLGEGHEETDMRTKVRRLYDIVNVLSSLNLIEKIQQPNTKNPAFRWLAKAGKPKTETGVTVALPPSAKTVTNKRTFGTDLTNIDMNRSSLDSTIQKKAKIAKSGSDILKSRKLSVQSRFGQGNRSGFVYGPFHSAGARKQVHDGANKSGQRDRAEDWESLSALFRPQYQNQALGDLFAHYVEAWKSWYSDLAQGNNIVRQHLGQSAINQIV